MTYEMYHNIFLICSVAAGVMGLVTIVLFFGLKIPAVIGELTGITARKGIEEIRSGNVKKPQKKQSSRREKPQKKQREDILSYGMMQQAQEQANAAQTERLSQNAAQNFSANETETILLGAEFEVLQDITILHTEESVSDQEYS